MSAVLLVGLGFLAGLLLPRGRRRATLVEQRRSTVRALRRLGSLVGDVAEAVDELEPDLGLLVAEALTDVLHLRGCAFEPSNGPVLAPPLPELLPDGQLEARVVHRVARGVVLPEATAIRAGRGRFVLAGSSIGCTLEERIVAGAMVAVADQAAASEVRPARSARRR